jgi:hypothetical protein
MYSYLPKVVYFYLLFTINISISNIVVDTIHNYVVFPYQSLSIESDTVNIFELDSAYYSCDSIYPFEYTIVSQSKRFRNIDVVNMAIQAFNYNPYNKRLSIIKSFQVRLDFDKSYTDSIKYELKPIQEMYNYTVANYNPLITKSQATDDTYDLLIIAPDDYLSNSDLLEFIAWKNQKGYKTKLISTLVTGNTPSSIKNYIENEFLDHQIAYVLFVGDYNEIPHVNNEWGCDTCSSDWPNGVFFTDFGYGDFGEDYLPEVLVGRFSIQNTQELANIINKSIAYETTPPLNNWLTKCLLVAHKEGAPNNYQGCSESIRNTTYSDDFLDFDIAYGSFPQDGGNSATNQTIINAINDGRGFVNYRGHGHPQDAWHKEWSYEDIGFGASQINLLNNNTKTPIIVSISCTNGWIKDIYGLGELFMCTNTGAVAFFGSIRTSYTVINHLLDRKIFKLFRSNLDLKTISNTTTTSIVEMLNYYGFNCYAKWNARCYGWQGDPTLEFWTDIPNDILEINCDKDLCVTNESTDFEISINNLHEGDIALVSIYKKNEIIEYQTVVGNIHHQAELEFSDMIFDNEGVVTITVSSHNYIPKSVEIAVEEWEFSCNEVYPLPIEIDYLEDWDDVKYINRDIIIESFGSLCITSDIFIHEDVNIIVKNGGRLQIYYDGLIEDGCGNTWNGITVEEGGFLNLSGTIKNFRFISIQDGATFNYNTGANIELTNNNSILDIAGSLIINAYHSFTFTGEGYIKFSKPGNDLETEDNIIAGTNASFVLEGTGKNDKKMEIQQSSVHFPELAELRFEDCKIEMGTGSTGLGARMQTSASTSPITFENIKITSDDIGINNNHRSFHLYGQSNVTINNCIFENGKYGLYGILTHGGSGLSISNSVFQNNQYGLWIYDKCINITDCDFYNNSYDAIKCTNMSHSSLIEDCNFLNISTGGNIDCIDYTGSASADLEVSYAVISYADEYGIFASGGFELDLNCSDIQNCGYGVGAINGNYLVPYANDIILNDTSIYLNNSLIDLANNGNILYSTDDNYALFGYTPLRWRNCQTPPNLTATNNIWESDLLANPQYNTNHKLKVYDACLPVGLPVNVIDATPGQLDCFSFGGLGLSSVSLNPENPNDNNNVLNTLCDDFSLLNSENAFQTELSNYCNAIQNFDPTNTSEFLQKRKAYADAHKLLNAYYEHVAFNTESLGINSAIDMLQDLNYALINTESETEYAKIDYDLDIGLLERYRGNYDAAISHLEALILEIQEYEPELFFVEKWLCSLYAEKLLTEGSINYDEFDALIMECEARYEENMATLSDELPANESTNNNEENNYMQISPNPNDGSFTVNINCELNNAEIRVSNSIGQPISTTVLSNTGEQVINITGLSVGQYTVYYIINGSVIESDVVFVE